jgi:hypothetical protein
VQTGLNPVVCQRWHGDSISLPSSI